MIKFKVGGLNVAVLGDVHLGKRFERGVPLDRRGDRESMQWRDFDASLHDVVGCAVHVQMGDLFDKWFVSYDTVYRAAEIYRAAASANPRVEYYLLMGNHDGSRDLEKVSAFKIFTGLVRGVPNITVVDDSPKVWQMAEPLTTVMASQVRFSSTKLVFVPWSPEHTAEEMVRMNAHLIQDTDATFHHCDVVAIGQTDNLLPAAALVELGVKRSFTGHDHTRRELVMDGLPVTVTGSMQPYSHAEDPEGRLYVTCTLAELKDTIGEPGDEHRLHDYCVRLRLDPGEALDAPLDCLQLTLDYVGSVSSDDEDVEVQFSAFNFDQLFKESMEGAEVDPIYIERTRARWDEERAKS